MINPISRFLTPHFFAMVIFLSLLTVAPPADALRGTGTKVLIARDTEMSGFEYRIKAELESAGFTVHLFEMDFREDTKRAIDIEAHAQNAAAAIVCRQSAGVVEIWISDKVTNKSVRREITIPDDEDADAFVAIAAVELLRASLLEVHTASQLTGSVAPTAEIEQLIAPADAEAIDAAWAPKKTSKLALQINPALFIMRFNGNPMLNIQLSIAYAVFKRLEFRIHGQTPVLPHLINKNDGEVTIRTGYIAGGIDWILVHPKHIASGDVGFGMAMLVHRISGQPAAGHIGHQGTFWMAAPHVVFGMDVRASQSLRIRLETIGGWSLSKISVYIDGQEVAEIGNFFVSIGLGLQFMI